MQIPLHFVFPGSWKPSRQCSCCLTNTEIYIVCQVHAPNLDSLPMQSTKARCAHHTSQQVSSPNAQQSHDLPRCPFQNPSFAGEVKVSSLTIAKSNYLSSNLLNIIPISFDYYKPQYQATEKTMAFQYTAFRYLI